MWLTERSPQAQQIIDRLAAINYEQPNICEQRIRDAFTQHLKALNQCDRPVEIYRSFYAAFDAAWEVMFFDTTWQAAIDATWKATCDAAQEIAREAAPEIASAATSDAALEVARKVAFDAGLAEAKKSIFEVASDVPDFGLVKVAREAAFRTAKKTVSDPLWHEAWNITFDQTFFWAWREASQAASSAARAVKGAAKKAACSDAFKATFRQVWVAARSYASRVASSAAQEAAYIPRDLALAAARNITRDAVLEAAFDGDWSAMRLNLKEGTRQAAMAVEIVYFMNSSPEFEQLCAVWMPLIDALEAGLFCFWMTPNQVLVLTAPVMRLQNDRLHADGQPAVQWSDWEGYYFWRGIQIPQKYGAVLSQNWRSQWLLEESNAEFRRILIQGIGYDHILEELEAVELDTWREYSLLKIQTDLDLEPIHLLKMTCPSTNHIHVLRVPPNLTSARVAISWVNWDIDPEVFVAET